MSSGVGLECSHLSSGVGLASQQLVGRGSASPSGALHRPEIFPPRVVKILSDQPRLKRTCVPCHSEVFSLFLALSPCLERLSKREACKASTDLVV